MATGGLPIIGIGLVTVDGFIQLISVLASDIALQNLAKWVVANVEQYPSLAQLKNAQFINVSPEDVVRSSHTDPTLWNTVPDPIFRGSSAETLKRLRSLKREEQYWFWLAEYGPLDHAMLHLQPVAKDPEGKDFLKQIQRLRNRASKLGAEVRGIVQQSKGDTFLFTTDSNIAASQKIISALDLDVQKCLHDALFLQREGDRVVDSLIVVGSEGEPQNDPYITELIAALHTLNQTGDQCFFWMGNVNNTTHLLLSQDKNRLKKLVLQLGKPQHSARGNVVVSKQSWLEFRTKTPYPNFINQLIAWTCSKHSTEFDLSRIRGARMTRTDAENKIIDRQKNTAGWEQMT